MSLATYQRKRNFRKTPEPSGIRAARRLRRPLSFVVQEHHASHLHYDFRLELDGVLKSWAVPKGPATDPQVKRLAIEVEDHPLKYGKFEGKIPKGQYGAGEVFLWDQGTWTPTKDPHHGLKVGRLEFSLKGTKLSGDWVLVRTRPTGKQKSWLLIKRKTNTKLFGVQKPARFTPPQLAFLSEKPPRGPGWIHEVKFDGYRVLVHVQNGKPTFLTRNGLNWSDRFVSLKPIFEKLKVENAWIDGEVCVFAPDGRSQFQSLQNSLTQKKPHDLVFVAFDLLELNGDNLRSLPLRSRKERLRALFSKTRSKSFLLSDHWEGDGNDFLKAACKKGLEGIVSKRIDGSYHPGRDSSWIKSKCHHDQEFVIGGYSLSEKGGAFKSLLLGLKAPKKKGLQYVGRVGTGFSVATARKLSSQLKKLKTTQTPFSSPVPNENRWRKADEVQWIKPKLVAQIEFRGWTQGRQLRQASFKGLREDKPMREVTSEPKIKTPEVRLTHPKKILIPEARITKSDLVDYLRLAAPQMLKYAVGRPLSLFRCPDGIRGECFFQKHLTQFRPPQLDTEDVRGPSGKSEQLIYLNSTDGLEALAQLGVLEVHARGTHREHTNSPDLMVFDLDPGPGVPWKKVIRATYKVRDALKALGLQSFVMTSGGKGFHVHVPIEASYTWYEVKEFAKTLATHLSFEEPDLFVATVTKSKRSGKIFIDYLRNGYGATSIVPYSVRARPGGPVAMPIHWNEVADVRANSFKLKALLKNPARLAKTPWKGYERPQKIEILSTTSASS